MTDMTSEQYRELADLCGGVRMTDPAVEAGYRALIAVSGGEWIRGEALILAAREMAAPIRELLADAEGSEQ